MSQRVGYMLAAAVVDGIRRAVPLPGSGISAAGEKVRLERYTISDEMLRQAREFLANPVEDDTRISDGLPLKESGPVWIEMHEQQEEPDEAEVMAVRIGGLGIATMPGEVFCESGLYIKERSAAPHTMVFELANDAVGYLPPPAAFPLGGYEVQPGSARYAPGAAEKLADAGLGRMEELFR